MQKSLSVRVIYGIAVPVILPTDNQSRFNRIDIHKLMYKIILIVHAM
ncbi:hypothetical protein [Chryseobacterium sp.]|nr:hypothetical protein [Chryseobacterium sp.]